MSAKIAFKIGDKVVVNPMYGKADGFVYEVTELPKGSRGVNYRLKNLSTGSFTRGPSICFLPASEVDQAVVKVIPFQEHLAMGNIVQTVGDRWGGAKGKLFVVLGSKNDDSWKIAMLGGDEGRFYDNIPRDMIKKVTFGDITISESTITLNDCL